LQCIIDGHEDSITWLERWENDNPAFMKRWKHFISDLRSTSELKLIIFSVVVRELVNMVAAYSSSSATLNSAAEAEKGRNTS